MTNIEFFALQVVKINLPKIANALERIANKLENNASPKGDATINTTNERKK